MSIIHGNDEELRKLTQENSLIIVKYHTAKCPICERLVPVYKNLSEAKEYNEIKFVRMNADENPVAKLFVKDQSMPFVATYKNGLLIECRTVQTEDELKYMLNKLVEAKNF